MTKGLLPRTANKALQIKKLIHLKMCFVQIILKHFSPIIHNFSLFRNEHLTIFCHHFVQYKLHTFVFNYWMNLVRVNNPDNWGPDKWGSTVHVTCFGFSKAIQIDYIYSLLIACFGLSKAIQVVNIVTYGQILPGWRTYCSESEWSTSNTCVNI